jgi:UDP-glucose 4-epimerase
LQAIVVTGASGFLGASITERLLKENLPVIGTSRRAEIGLVQVADYRNIPEAEVVIHLAEDPHRERINRESEEYFRLAESVVRTLCLRSNRVIYASSGTVYGDQSTLPFTTNMPVHATDQYSQMKIRHERIVCEANGSVMRLSNVYGSRMSPNNVLSDILRQIPGRGDLKIRDDRPVRDFVSVESAALAFALASRSPVPGILNVGSGVGISVGDLARSALRAAGQAERAVVATHPVGRRSVNVLDIQKTRECLGWPGSVPVQDYFADWFKNGVNGVLR